MRRDFGSDIDGEAIPEYSLALFQEFIAEMKKQSENDNIWINHHDLDRKENLDIKVALFGEGMLFDRLSIDKSRINAVQQYEWKIEGDEYTKCKELAALDHVQSPSFVYNIASDCVICFHFNFYARMSFEDEEYCGIFVEIDEMPEDIKRLDIEVDIKCNEKRAYRQLMRDQKLTQKKRVCGFRIFATKVLDSNTYFDWIFGVKIFNLKMTETDDGEMEDGFDDADLDGMYQRLWDLY